MLSKMFYESETRDGIYISKQTKESWAKQIEILLELDRVCKKNNLKYWALCGTLLGAVRHKGFIPWDDDIDVVMMREDYDTLSKIANKELKDHYFWQDYNTDQILRGHAELRDSSTTGFMKCDYKVNYNTGMFIDVFALDNIEPNDKKDFLIKLYEKYKSIRKIPGFQAGASYPILASLYNNWILPIRKLVYKKSGWKETKQGIIEYSKLCQKYNDVETGYVAMVEFSGTMPTYSCPIYSKKDFDDTVYLDFEEIKIPCPAGYHNILTSNFGEYMIPVKGTSQHDKIFFDPQKSYIEYKKEIKNYSDFCNLFQSKE